MEDERPLDIRQVRIMLKTIIEGFDELLESDLSSVTVDGGWSRVPHVGDHVQFLRNSAAKLHDHMRSVAPGTGVQGGDEDGHRDEQDGQEGHVP